MCDTGMEINIYMNNKNYDNVMHLGNPTNTIAVLNRYGFNFQKKFGQNFLIDENVVQKIVREAGVTEDDFVLEVGPGIGTMTQILCENAREVVAVEIDKKLIPILTEDTLSWYDNVTVINEDILKLDIKKLAEQKNGGKPIKVVANLPYYITTPIIMGLFESLPHLRDPRERHARRGRQDRQEQRQGQHLVPGPDPPQ